MQATPKRLNATEPGAEWLQQWTDAELLEQVELLEAQVESLKAERDRLKVELHFSRGWAEESLWSEKVRARGEGSESAARAADEAVSIAPSHFATLEEEELGPIVWGGFCSSSASSQSPAV